MTQLPARTDVLVVGAGPAGLALTTALALDGVDHVAIEAKPAAAPGSKAAGVQPRTLKWLDRIGAADDLVAAGLRGTGFEVHDGPETLLRAGYAGLDTPFPFMLLVGQETTEAVLERRLPAVGGVHSRVRAESGIPFTGTTPEQRFALADVTLADPPTGLDTSFSPSPHGMLLMSALPGGRHRVVAAVGPDVPAPGPADVERLVAQRTGRTVRVAELAAASTYGVQQKVAERLVDGPVVLLGDAAHTHSPAGGQGMNTGIQDAANLAWRLTEIVRHDADPLLLHGFHDERHPVALGLIAFTGQLTAVTTLTDPVLAGVRTAVLRAVADRPEITGWLSGRLSQLDLGYAGGAGLVAGNRFPPTRFAHRPRRPGWVLATAAGDTHPRAETVAAPGLPEPVLVRPDGIIATAVPA